MLLEIKNHDNNNPIVANNSMPITIINIILLFYIIIITYNFNLSNKKFGLIRIIALLIF